MAFTVFTVLFFEIRRALRAEAPEADRPLAASSRSFALARRIRTLFLYSSYSCFVMLSFSSSAVSARVSASWRRVSATLKSWSFVSPVELPGL